MIRRPIVFHPEKRPDGGWPAPEEKEEEVGEGVDLIKYPDMKNCQRLWLFRISFRAQLERTDGDIGR